MTITAGIDIGGTNLRAAAVLADGTIVAETSLLAPAGWVALRDAMVTLIQDLRAEVPDLAAVGVGAAGMVDRNGVVAYSPNVHAFADSPVRSDLEERLSLPIAVDNDANVAALAEARLGAARGCAHALVITLGTGIGGGVIVNGEVLRGAHGFAAEVGHFQIDPQGPICACGERGHWEALASGNALGWMGREAAAAGSGKALIALAGDIEAVRGDHVGEASLAGDPDALAILDRYAEQVAIGLVGLANIFDPERIVISGGLVALGDLLLDPVRSHFMGRVEGASARETLTIVAATLGTQAGVVGAALLARDLIS
ncbi:MAG: ROK family protein [Acidimicrobiia bacterium]|nr:ROK family protein [Acidimicrobiia bacterium]